jgi:hypothetical protein
MYAYASNRLDWARRIILAGGTTLLVYAIMCFVGAAQAFSDCPIRANPQQCVGGAAERCWWQWIPTRHEPGCSASGFIWIIGIAPAVATPCLVIGLYRVWVDRRWVPAPSSLCRVRLCRNTLIIGTYTLFLMSAVAAATAVGQKTDAAPPIPIVALAMVADTIVALAALIAPKLE